MASMHNARSRLLPSVVSGSLMLAPVISHATCWEAAANAYGIPVAVLKAVAKTESSFNPKAKNRNPNGTFDIGLMQINSAWLPTLKQYRVDEVTLQEPCTNLKVGAWILANNAKKLGWNWNAIGAYNVGCSNLDIAECDRRRSQYAWKIHAALTQVSAQEVRSAPDPTLPYERGATSVSAGVLRQDQQIVSPKKIMVMQVDSVVRVVDAAGSRQGVGKEPLSIGGFLNYEGGGDE